MKKLQLLVAGGAVALLAGCGSQQASNVTTVVESQDNVVVSTNEVVANAVVANGTAAVIRADESHLHLVARTARRAGLDAFPDQVQRKSTVSDDAAHGGLGGEFRVDMDRIEVLRHRRIEADQTLADLHGAAFEFIAHLTPPK